ncbi:MAG: hypothetical protein L0216_01595 [Planctomycetales bacterium]|nr:hypothetical protein [Planctomycetales bacterium]
MRTWIALAIAFGMSALGAGCGKKEPPPPTVTMDTYANKKHGFSFKHPKGGDWALSEPSSDSVTVTLGVTTDVEIVCEATASEEDFSDFLAKDRKEWKKNPSFKLVSESDTKVSGMPARRIQSTYKEPIRGENQDITTHVKKGNWIYTLRAATSVKRFPKYEKRFEEVHNSFALK